MTSEMSSSSLEGDHVRAVAGGFRHQPDAHLRDDTEVRLRKDAVHVRTEAVLEQLPGVVARHRAHAGSHDVAAGQHDFHAALHHEVIAIRRVTHSMIQRIAHHAAPARVRHVEPQFEAVRLDVVVEVEVADARLDQRVAELLVHLEDAVHAAHVEHDGARQHRRRAAVREVLAARDRPQRNAGSVCGLDDRLHLLRRMSGATAAWARKRVSSLSIGYGSW